MRLSWAAKLCAILRNDSCSVVNYVFLGRNYSLYHWIFFGDFLFLYASFS